MVMPHALKKIWESKEWQELVDNYQRAHDPDTGAKDQLAAASMLITLGTSHLNEALRKVNKAKLEKPEVPIFGGPKEFTSFREFVSWLGKKEIAVITDVIMSDEFLTKYCTLFSEFDSEGISDPLKLIDKNRKSIEEIIEKSIHSSPNIKRPVVGQVNAINAFIIDHFIRTTLIGVKQYYKRIEILSYKE